MLRHNFFVDKLHLVIHRPLRRTLVQKLMVHQFTGSRVKCTDEQWTYGLPINVMNVEVSDLLSPKLQQRQAQPQLNSNVKAGYIIISKAILVG